KIPPTGCKPGRAKERDIRCAADGPSARLCGWHAQLSCDEKSAGIPPALVLQFPLIFELTFLRSDGSHEGFHFSSNRTFSSTRTASSRCPRIDGSLRLLLGGPRQVGLRKSVRRPLLLTRQRDGQ